MSVCSSVPPLPCDPHGLFRWLRRQKNLRVDICHVLKENNVGGTVLLKLTRADLSDLLPGDFLARKQLWDVVESLQGSSVENADKCEEEDDLLSDENSPSFKPAQTSSPVAIPSLKRGRSLSPSAMSVDSESQSDASFEFDMTQSTHKRAKYTKWDDFVFPTPPGLQGKKEVPESTRKQVIREVYTCMKAYCPDDKFSSNDFIAVAKKVCKRIPQLKDQEPPGLKYHGEFCYWGTVLYLLRRRHSNLKRTGTEEASKKSSAKGKKTAEAEEASPQDVEKHHKQLMVELRKKSINYEAVRKLQSLSFQSRAEDIASNFHGSDVVNAIVKKYPFLQIEHEILCELELHMQKVNGEEATISSFFSNWERLAPYLCEKETPEGGITASALTNLVTFFKDCPPIVLFVDQTSGDVDEFIKQQTKSNSPKLASFTAACTEDNSPVSGQLFIVIDKNIFLEIEGEMDYSKGLLLLLAVHYCFNLQYDNNQKLLFQFLEEHVLGLKPLRRTFKYSQLCNKIFGRRPRVNATED